jgi:HAD superfamily hydrolase (TIGR01509 family)
MAQYLFVVSGIADLLKAFLIDLDGTLANSEPLKGRALADTCVLYGGEVTASVYAEVMGQDWETVTAHFFKSAKISPPYEEFNSYFRTHYMELLEDVALTDGVLSFLLAAQRKGMRLAVVSSAAPWMVDKVLTKLGIDHLFELVITQQDVTRHKPDPQAYELALERLGVTADEVIVFEDSYAGLRAAASAGCRSVALRHEFNSRHDTSLAVQVVSSFAEVEVL